jgi:hypothetical protein
VSEWDYEVEVKWDSDDEEYYGKLVCDENHPCANMQYDLNSGAGHIKKNKTRKT